MGDRLMLRRRALLGGIRLRTVTGAIASFVTSITAPLQRVVAHINPVQDLHGYSYPWAAGGGKNLFDVGTNFIELGAISSSSGEDSSSDTRCRTHGFVSVKESTQYTVSVHLKGEVNPSKVFVLEYGENESYLSLSSGWQTSPYTFTTGAETKYIRLVFAYSGDTAIAVSNVETVQLELGATESAWVPYENECPITGFTGLTVSQTGEDFYKFDGTIATSSTKVEKITDDSFRVYRNGSSNYPSSKQLLSEYNLTLGKTYYISADAVVTSGTARISTRASNNNTIATTENLTESGHLSFVFTFTSEMNYLSFFAGYGERTGDVTYSNIQFCEVGTTSVTFPDPPETVYGGALTVNEDGTGVLSTRCKIVTMNGTSSGRRVDSKGSAIAYNSFYFADSDGYKYPDPGYVPASAIYHNYFKCNMAKLDDIPADSDIFAYNAYVSSNANRNLQPRFNFHLSTGIDTVTKANNYFKDLYDAGTPVVISYPTNSTTSYQMTAEEVGQIMALRGENHIWHDANGDITVDYYG